MFCRGWFLGDRNANVKDNNNEPASSALTVTSNDDNIIDVDVSSLSPAHEKELSSQEFITLLEGHAKTYLQKIKLTVTATNSLLLPILFVNAIPIFFHAKNEVEEDLNLNPYYLFSPKIKQALSYDLATANAEASAITTTLVLSALTLISFSIPYHIKKYYSIRDQLHILMHSLDIKSFTDSMRIKMLSIPREHLIQLNEAISRHGKKASCMSTLEKPLSFYEKLDWFNEEVSRYIDPATMLAFIPGFIFMYMATNDFKDGWECEVSPFLSFFSDSCKVIEQYTAMSAITYLWDTVSVVWLSLHSLATVARVASIPFERFRELIYKFHAPFEKFCKDNERWLYKDLIGEIMSRFLLIAAAYSVYRAVNLINRFSLDTNCEKFPDFFGSLNDSNSNPDCMTAEKSMTVSGVIVILEFLTFYPLFISSKSLSFVTWMVAEKCFSVPLLSRETARKMLDKFRKINSNNAALALLVCLLVGIPAFVMSNTFANNFLKEGLVKTIHMDGDSMTVTVHEPCPSYGFISLFFDNLFHRTVQCDPAFWRRVITSFVSPFWLETSVATASTWIASELVFMTKWMLEVIIDYCRQDKYSKSILIKEDTQNTNRFFSARIISQDALKININEVDNDKSTPLLDTNDRPNHKHSSYGCFGRIINRFFKTPKLPTENSTLSPVVYQPSSI